LKFGSQSAEEFCDRVDRSGKVLVNDKCVHELFGLGGDAVDADATCFKMTSLLSLDLPAKSARLSSDAIPASELLAALSL
jgi:hypothetical protein